jgi:hypothetical protein
MMTSRTVVAKSPLYKAAAFAGGLGLSMFSYPVHAAPSTIGGTVQGLYDTLLNTMKNGRILGQSGPSQSWSRSLLALAAISNCFGLLATLLGYLQPL